MNANDFYRGLLGVNDEPSGLGLLDPTDVQRRNAINQGLLTMGASIANASGAQRLPVSTAQVISDGLLAGNQGYNAGIKTAYDQQKENVMNNAALQNYQRQNMMMDYVRQIMGGANPSQPSSQASYSQQGPYADGYNSPPQGLLPQPAQSGGNGLLSNRENLARVGIGLGALKQDPGAIISGTELLYPKGMAVREGGMANPFSGEQILPPMLKQVEGLAQRYNPQTRQYEYYRPVGSDLVAQQTGNMVGTKEAAEAPYRFVERFNSVTHQLERIPLSSVTPPAPQPPQPVSAPTPQQMQMPGPAQSYSPNQPTPQPSSPSWGGQGQPSQPGMQLTQPQQQPPGAPPLDPPIVRRMQPEPQIIGQNITGSQGGFPMLGRDQAIPARGLSGFPSGPALSESTEQKGIGEANAGVYKTVLTQGAAAHDTMNSVALLDSLYKDGLNTGNYAPLLTKAASLAKSAGMDPGSFRLADPKNATVYEKTVLGMGFQFARSNLPGQRITQQEVAISLKANPNVTNPNDTNQLLQATIYGAAAYKDNMQNTIQMYMDQNKGSTQGFQQWYNQHYNVMDFYRGAYKDGVWVQPPQKPAEGGFYNLPNVGWAKYLGNGKWQPR